MNEFSNVRDSYFKLKVMYKNTFFEDNRKKRNLTANNCIFGQKLSHIWQKQSSWQFFNRWFDLGRKLALTERQEMRTWTRDHPTFSIRDWSDGKDKNKTKHNFCIHMFTLRQHAYAFTSAINGCIILKIFKLKCRASSFKWKTAICLNLPKTLFRVASSLLIDMLFYSHLEIQQVNTQDIRDAITFL